MLSNSFTLAMRNAPQYNYNLFAVLFQESEVELFINELAEEVQKRLQALDMKGRCITLKVKKKFPF